MALFHRPLTKGRALVYVLLPRRGGVWISGKLMLFIRCTYIRGLNQKDAVSKTYIMRKNTISIRCLYIRGLNQMNEVSKLTSRAKNSNYFAVHIYGA